MHATANIHTTPLAGPTMAPAAPIAHIAGHEHIAPGRKADPGAGFDWPRLQQALAWDARFFPAGVLPIQG